MIKNTNNARILARKTCILLYYIHGPPVFRILGQNARTASSGDDDVHEAHVGDEAHAAAAPQGAGGPDEDRELRLGAAARTHADTTHTRPVLASSAKTKN